MDCTSTRLPYRQTNAFSTIIMDYLDHADTLKPFFAHPPTMQGIQRTIEARKNVVTNRKVLVEELRRQYDGMDISVATEKNIATLLNDTTFTITTAHQPVLFTGPLYFLYKILHTIRLAENFKTLLPQYDFVPVYYMGSEDADIEELGHFYLEGEKKIWTTKQTGAVGRMRVDKELVKMITAAEGQLSVLPHGDELIRLLKQYYKEGTTIEAATFQLVNYLFSEYGLVIILPDNAAFKKQMIPIFKDELINQLSSGIVETSAAALDSAGYKVQANPREINLFYLKDDKRERIEIRNNNYEVLNTSLSFSRDAILEELQQHPERFSPNVILRGLYQETILPNIAFVGGGGETAYWLQLKNLFEQYKVSFPVLILRNSFLIIETKWQSLLSKLGFIPEELFLPQQELINRLVKRDTDKKLQLNGTFSAAEQLYDGIKDQASLIDTTLVKHVESLKVNTLYRLAELEKKMLRAEKRKFADQQRQIATLKEKLFPANGLQERVDNFMSYYASYGKAFIEELFQHTLSMEQEFVILSVR